MVKINFVIQYTNRIFATFIGCIAVHALFIIIRDISGVYQGWQLYFDQQGSIYPAAITIVTALVPVSLSAIAYLVYLNKRTYYIGLPVVHVFLMFSSYAVCGMMMLLIIWWFSKRAIKGT